MSHKCLFAFLITFSSITGYPQGSTLDQITSALKAENYLIVENRYANLKQGEISYQFRTILQGLSYIFIAYSEDIDVRDIDVYLYDSDGSVLKSDTKVINLAAVAITPSYSREIKIVMKNYKSFTPNYASLCRYIIAYK